MIIYAKLQSSRVRHQYGIFGGESQTSFTRNATRAGSEEGRLFSLAICSSPSKKFVHLKCRKNEVYLEIKETTKCVGSSNEKEASTLDHRTSLEEDLLLPRCFVLNRLWKVGWSGMALSGESNEFKIGNWIAIASQRYNDLGNGCWNA